MFFCTSSKHETRVEMHHSCKQTLQLIAAGHQLNPNNVFNIGPSPPVFASFPQPEKNEIRPEGCPIKLFTVLINSIA